MMTAPIVGKHTQPANVNANKPAPAAEQKIAVNAAASAVAQPKLANAGGRGSAKATMIGAGVPAEVLKAAQSQAAGAPKLTAAAAQPQAKLGGAPHRKVPEAADTKRSAPPPKTAAAAPTKELGSPHAKLKTPAAGQTQALGSPPAKAATSQTGPKLGVPQTSPKLTPAQNAPSEVSATANTDEPPPPKSPSVRAVMNLPISQPPEAQFAATQAALPGPPPRPPSMQQREPSIVVEAEAEVVPTTPAVVVQAEHAQPRYLPGDPMAPQAVSPMRAPRTKIPGDEDITVPREERAWLYWAVCGTVVLVVVLLAFGLFR